MIAKDDTSTADFGFSNTGTLTYSYTFSAVNNMMIVSAFTQSSTSTAAYNGNAMTELGKKGMSGNGYYQYTWFILGPASGAHNLVISNAGNYCRGGIASYSGVKQTGQPDSSVTAGGDSVSSVTGTTTVVGTGCWLIGGISNRDGSLTAGAGTTLRWVSGTFSIIDSNGTVGTGSQSLVVNISQSTDASMVMGSFLPAPEPFSPFPSHYN